MTDGPLIHGRTAVEPVVRSGSTPARRIGAVMIQHAYSTVRSPHRFFDIAVWPALDMVLYGSIATYAMQGGPLSAADRTTLSVVAGIIMWHILYQAQLSVSISFFEDVHARQLPSLLATPLRPVEWVLGAALQGLVKVGIGFATAAGAAALLYGFDITNAGPTVLPIMALLLLTGWALALVVISLVMFLGHGSEVLTFGLLFVILPLSGAFYSVSALPPIIQPVSAILPTTYVFQAARDAVDGGPAPWGAMGVAGLATAGLIVGVVAFAAIALRTFQRRGSISRYL